MEVVVQLQADAARLRQENAPPNEPLQELQQFLDGLGVVLKPVHPGVQDSTLAQYFTVDVAHTEDAERIAAALRRFRAVEAAYAKPDAEVP